MLQFLAIDLPTGLCCGGLVLVPSPFHSPSAEHSTVISAMIYAQLCAVRVLHGLDFPSFATEATLADIVPRHIGRLDRLQ